LRGPGFSLTEVGAINKGFGLAATIIGALAGGALMAKMRLYRALLLFGVLQALTNLGFMLLAASGKSYALMVAVIGMENLCGGMGTAAYVALLMALCDRRFSATQYALLSALSAVGRVYVGPIAGYLVAGYGWQAFFFFTFVIALPGLALLVLRETGTMVTLLVVHLGVVLALFVTLPYGKFVHGLYRAAALVKSANESSRE